MGSTADWARRGRCRSAVQQHQAGRAVSVSARLPGLGTRWLRRALSRLPPKVSLRPTALKLSTLAPLCATTLKRCSLQIAGAAVGA